MAQLNPSNLPLRELVNQVKIGVISASGTSFDTDILRVSPEAAIAGALVLVQDGDLIEIEIEACTIEHKI